MKTQKLPTYSPPVIKEQKTIDFGKKPNGVPKDEIPRSLRFKKLKAIVDLGK